LTRLRHWSTPCEGGDSFALRDRIRRRSWVWSETWEDHMKMIQVAIVSGLIALAGPASAQGMDHTMLGPQDVKWAKAPPSVPPGAEASVLYGDPGKDGLFVLRLKLPKGTVISGTFTLGMGNVADKSNAKPLPAGSFFAFAPGMAHYAF